MEKRLLEFDRDGDKKLNPTEVAGNDQVPSRSSQ